MKHQDSLELEKNGLIILAQHRVEDAMTMFQEQRGDHGILYWNDALEIVASIRGTYHIETAKLYLGLAGTLRSQRNFHKAINNYHRAIQIYQVVGKEGDQGDYKYSKGSIQAWIGLGITYSHLEMWHEAMKAFQSAARIDLYNLILDKSVESANTKNTDSNPTRNTETIQYLSLECQKLSSIKYLKEWIEVIENYHSKNRNQVWSHFPNLPNNIASYLDSLQATVHHEVNGDLFYQKGWFEAARQEYQTALDVFQEQVHSTHHAGIPVDKIWLFRKRALAELGMDLTRFTSTTTSTSIQKLHTYRWIPLNTLMTKEYHHDCAMFGMVCDILLEGDRVLQEATSNHKQLVPAFHCFEEARALAKFYHSTYSTLGLLDNNSGGTAMTWKEKSLATVENMKRPLSKLKKHLIPEGYGQTKESTEADSKLVWEELRHLSILVEAQEYILSTSMEDPHLIDISKISTYFPLANGDYAVLLWLMALLLQFIVLPLVLLRTARKVTATTGPLASEEKMNQKGNVQSLCNQQVQEQQCKRDLCGRVANGIPTLASGESSTLDKAFLTLEMLDRIEVEVDGIPSKDKPDLLAKKVSALVTLQRTRKSILAFLKDEDDKDRDRDDINGQIDVQAFLDRMQDLGFGNILSKSASDWMTLTEAIYPGFPKSKER